MREITYAMTTMPGDRPYNEDYVKAVRDGDTWVFAVADGLGGQGCGDLASSSAVESIFEESPDLLAEDFFQTAFETAQQRVLDGQSSSEEAGRMCTTLVLLRLADQTADWCHIGDTRLYRFHGWFLKEQTRDHSVPQMLADLGDISVADIRHHPDRSRLLKVIGQPWEGTPYVLSGPRPLKKRDSFLLCSDGFWEFITERDMGLCLVLSRSAQDWLDRMTEIVLRNGKGHNMDNLSAICVQVK